MDSTFSLPEEFHSLPQYGFDPEDTFDRLVKQNPFLFRVYTPKHRSLDETDLFFIGQSFNERYTLFPEKLSGPSAELHDVAATASYSDVVVHMEWTTRASSPYISTSFSFVWALWEAVRRYRLSMKHDVEIAVIDAQALAGRAITAAELLRRAKKHERHRDHDKWHRFAMESQDVLVYESIPGSAIYSSLPLLPLLERIPSYFLRSDASKASSLDRLAWSPLAPKHNYRKFCHAMSELFLGMPPELRLRDTTVASVRLSAWLLRPYIRDTLSRDTNKATETLCKLSYIMAQWPGRWWTRDHTEMWDIIRATARVLVEEMQEHDRCVLADSRVVATGEPAEAFFALKRFVGEGRECALPRARASSCSSTSSATVASEAGSVRSVFTLVEAVDAPEESKDDVDMKRAVNGTAEDERPEMGTQTPPAALLLSKAIEFVGQLALVPTLPTPTPTPPPSPPLSSSLTVGSISDSTELTTDSEAVVAEDQDCREQQCAQSTTSPSPTTMAAHSPALQPHSMAETASCVVTALLFGAFIVLCVISSQRRTLATHLY